MDLDLDGLRHWDHWEGHQHLGIPHSRCQWTRGDVRKNRGEVSEVTRIHPLGRSKQLVDVTRT
jgi:hypothetical protein